MFSHPKAILSGWGIISGRQRRQTSTFIFKSTFAIVNLYRPADSGLPVLAPRPPEPCRYCETYPLLYAGFFG